MFWGEKDLVAAIIASIQKRVCAYGGHDRCDCKYAIDDRNILKGIEEGPGCCELRCAVEIIKNMTQAEWQRIIKRAERAKPKGRLVFKCGDALDDLNSCDLNTGHRGAHHCINQYGHTIKWKPKKSPIKKR